MINVIFTDGSTEQYDRTRTKNGFVHCYERVDLSVDKSEYNTRVGYWLTVLMVMSFTMSHPTHTKKKSVPKENIKEVKYDTD